MVTPSNALPACHVTVEGTYAELCICPVKENVNELFLLSDASVTTANDFFFHFVAPDAIAAEPPEVAGVPTYELCICLCRF